MNLSIFLAKIFSIYLVIVSIAILINKDVYLKAVREMVNDAGVMFLSAIITLILGILLITVHNLWVFDWRIVITLLGWLIFIKGAVRILFPKWIKPMTDKVMDNYVGFYITCVLSLIIGLYLGYYGFFR
jgi:phosphoglycerol transferase MdoB-like AlkP superfamily enzyme